MNRVIIGLGSNIDPVKNIRKAKEILAQKYDVLAESHLKTTRPIGDIHQADFINGSLLLKIKLDLDQLKDELKMIEAQLGRRKDHHPQGPRTIDLDIVVWNGKIVHQDFYERDYLKDSILELVPDLEYLRT